jgi:hypothetical protein
MLGTQEIYNINEIEKPYKFFKKKLYDLIGVMDVEYRGPRYLLRDTFSKTVRYYREHGFWKTISRAYHSFSKKGGITQLISVILSSREREECKVCNSGDLVLLEKKLNIHGIVDNIYICRNCLVITNLGRKYEETIESSLQMESSQDFYSYTAGEIKNIGLLVEANKDIIRSIMPYLGRVQDKVLLEIGSGKGLLLIAASEIGFKKALGVDYNTASFNETTKTYEAKDNVHMFRDVAAITIDDKVDCLVMWHTLEHIFEPNSFFQSINKRLNDGCILFIQVPQYNQPYLCNTHYHFYNEPSISLLLKNNGWQIIKIEYDLRLQFMTVVAKR